MNTNPLSPGATWWLLLSAFFMASILFGCHRVHAADAVAPSQLITDGPNKGLTLDQVLYYRIAGIRNLADGALQANNKAQIDLVTVQRKYDTLQSDDQKHIAGETYWRKRAQVILYAFALAIGLAFLREANKMTVTPLLGWEALVIPVVAFALGAGIGYSFGLFALGWLSQFLP
jgi:hypothetical protein